MKLYTALIIFALSANCHADSCERKDIYIKATHTGNATMQCVVCSDLTLNEIVAIDNRWTLSCLSFKDSIIPSITRYAFSSLSALEVLFLNNVGLRIINSGGFAGLRILKSLYLQNNEISYIPMEGFEECDQLNHLDLSNNSIADLDDISLNGVARLQELILSNNLITEVKADVFSPVPNLRLLDLSHNKIRIVSGDLFHMVPRLQKLIINKNSIPVIPRQFFSNALSLTVLDISNNNIKNFNFQLLPSTLNELCATNVNGNAMTNWTNLKISKITFSSNSLGEIEGVGEKINNIDLSNNEITIITATVFEEAVDLVHLNLSRNEIESFDPNAFKYTTKLQALYLAHNAIRNIPTTSFNSLHSLHVLDLSGNKLTRINTYGTFSGLINLSTLSLHDNEISYILESVFHDMINLRSLDISNNHLVTISAEEMVKALPSMNVLALGHNNWTCIELAELIGYFEAQDVEILPEPDNPNGIRCKKHSRRDPKPNNTHRQATNNTHVPMDLNVLEMYEKDFLNSDFYTFFNSKLFTPEFYEKIFLEMYKQTKLFEYLERLFPKSFIIERLKNVFNQNTSGEKCKILNKQTISQNLEETSEESVEDPVTAKKKALIPFIKRMKKGILWKLIS